MSSKKSARVDCVDGSFWVTPKLFWRWVREGLVELRGEFPLNGRYRGKDGNFHVSVNHVILNLACPEHFHEFLQIRRRHKACS